MAKTRTVFICTNCGANSPKWIGKCNSCDEWNTYQEEIIVKETKQEAKRKEWEEKPIAQKKPIDIRSIKIGTTQRILLKDKELARALGGGIVYGSLILVGGQPGIGKSTLLLQMALESSHSVLYVSGEESEEQIKMRANRIGIKNEDCYIYSETNIVSILKAAKKLNPQIIIIDSIQTLASPHIESTPGTVSQVRECTGELQRFAKETKTPIFIIGHITKDGQIAGPKLLEHIVDVVVQFEGDQNYAYRILRTIKNRFGSTDDIGIYQMMSNGLREVNNPSELLLSQHDEVLSGSAVGATLEGRRPMLIETQALVSPAIYGTPQRSATGFDLRRMSMLLAVLEKKSGLPFASNDVFLNMAGGIKVSDPAMDLSVVSALISSLNDIAIGNKICFAGEVGLSGEVRAVGRIEQRIKEAGRLGFEVIYISKYNAKGLSLKTKNIEVRYLSTVAELLLEVFA